MRWIIAAAFALLFATGSARAWGPAGHNIVCEIAWLDMTPAARTAVDGLLRADGQFRTFVRSCNYPDPPPERLRGNEHYANYRRNAARVGGPGCPTEPKCVLSAIDDDLAILRSTTAPQARKAKALKFIGHWFGDIHQPLHISFKDDTGGAGIRATGLCGKNIHSVWDGCIINRRIVGRSPARFEDAQAAALALYSEITPAEKAGWRRSETWRWAAESYEITLRPGTGYCVMKQGSCWYDDDRPGFRGQPRRVRIDDTYLDDAAPLVVGRLKRAGIRLAHALNLTFDPNYSG